MAGGRPLKWKSVKDIEPIIEEYFTNTPIEQWTITGLALALDTSRSTLIDYCNRADNELIDAEFSNTIRKAKEKVEHSYEIDLKKSGRTGTIFALKNFDWKDKVEQEHYGKDGGAIEVNVEKRQAIQKALEEF